MIEEEDNVFKLVVDSWSVGSSFVAGGVSKSLWPRTVVEARVYVVHGVLSAACRSSVLVVGGQRAQALWSFAWEACSGGSYCSQERSTLGLL